jgi:hypothetical protein
MRESRRGLIEFVVARAEGVNEFLSSGNAIPSTARLWACGLASRQPSSMRIYRSRSTCDGQAHGVLAGLDEVGNHPLRAIETSLNASDFMAGSSAVPAVEATVGGLCGLRIDVPIRPVTRSGPLAEFHATAVL